MPGGGEQCREHRTFTITPADLGVKLRVLAESGADRFGDVVERFRIAEALLPLALADALARQGKRFGFIPFDWQNLSSHLDLERFPRSRKRTG